MVLARYILQMELTRATAAPSVRCEALCDGSAHALIASVKVMASVRLQAPRSLGMMCLV